MSTLITERVKDMPSAIERVQDAYLKQAPATADTVTEIAAQTGSGQFVKDAKAFAVAVEKLTAMIKEVTGSEGDTVTDNGTVYAAYYAGLKTEEAFGGEQ